MKATQLKYYLSFSFILFLCACSSPPKLALPQLIEPANFKLQQIETPAEIFKLDTSLTRQLDSHLNSQNSAQHIAQGIFSFLLKNGDDSLAYRSSATLTAAQSYQNLNANCLSLSILAYSLAEHLGLKAQFQKVHIPEYWALDQGVNLLTGHINLSLNSQPLIKDAGTLFYQRDQRLIIDFDSNSRQARFKTTRLSKNTVTAMFYNNKGATALINKQYELAYSYFNAATKVAPNFSVAWGNLGVLFKQFNYLNEAEQAYNYALHLDKNNNTAQGNLAMLYLLTEREIQGTQILNQLDKQRQSNPYYHISLGNTEYVHKYYAKALKHFKKAYTLSPTLHESHFGLARVYFQWGDTKQAKYHLRKAGKNADFLHDKKRYDAKLKALQSLTAKVGAH